MAIQTGNLSTLILLALTPAFMLIGAGTMLRIQANRLARVVDRTRMLEEDPAPLAASKLEEFQAELEALARRRRLIHHSTLLCCICALLLCLVIVALFVTDLLDFELELTIAGLFILAAVCLNGSLLLFLREIQVSDQMLYLTIRRSPPARRRFTRK